MFGVASCTRLHFELQLEAHEFEHECLRRGVGDSTLFLSRFVCACAVPSVVSSLSVAFSVPHSVARVTPTRRVGSRTEASSALKKVLARHPPTHMVAELRGDTQWMGGEPADMSAASSRRGAWRIIAKAEKIANFPAPLALEETAEVSLEYISEWIVEQIVDSSLEDQSTRDKKAMNEADETKEDVDNVSEDRTENVFGRYRE